MPTRTINLREGQPLLDMPNSAYPGACRVRNYAEWASQWNPRASMCKAFLNGSVRITRHIFASHVALRNCGNRSPGQGTPAAPLPSDSRRGGFFSATARMAVNLNRIDRLVTEQGGVNTPSGRGPIYAECANRFTRPE